eukprot:m.151655 g.151655  ORF g.151655 m.151655 type:complete len:876 (+) comp30772_c0_seq2:72-2699(+)
MWNVVMATILVALGSSTVATAAPTIHVLTNNTRSDLLAVAQAGTGATVVRHGTMASLMSVVAKGDGVMFFADNILPSVHGSPQTNTTVDVDPKFWATAVSLDLKVFVEFPMQIPATSTPLTVAQTEWERVIATGSNWKSTDFPALALLHPHKFIDYVVLPATWLPSTSLVLAKVAGFDNASLGLPTPNKTFPMLASPVGQPNILVGATQLSQFRTRRFSPTMRWNVVAQYIVEFVSGKAWLAPPPTDPVFVASVTASFTRSEALPAGAELEAFVRGVQFYRNSRMLPTAQRASDLYILDCANGLNPACEAYSRLDFPYNASSGDGQLGVFEGLTSNIALDGNQPQSLGVRCDCVTEASTSFAVRGIVTNNKSDIAVATNLLNFGHIHSGYSQPWVVGGGSNLDKARPWASTGGAFGIKAWTTADNAYTEFYKDDDARGLLGALGTAGLLQSDRWHSTIVTGVLGNLRVTTKAGFGPSSSQFGNLDWKSIYASEAPPGGGDFSPHYQSYIWAVYLWGYSVSGFQPLYDRAAAALTNMMENYPTRWVPTANGIAMQRARIILPLAWLVRVNASALHVQWLNTAIDGFMTRSYCEGTWCTFKEELSHPGWGGSTRVPNNDDYGTFEAPLNQANDDPVSDFLYTTNFALLGLHEAAAATNNQTVQAIANRLAEFIVRIQARSTEHPKLDGAFFRAFDYVKWEAWASDADIGWGAWSVESGWTQSWITTVLGLRQLNTSLWDVSQTIKGIDVDFEAWIPTMFPPPSPPPPPPPCLPANASSGCDVHFVLATSLSSLCAPAPGKTVSHVHYNGTICGCNKHEDSDGASKNIMWNTAVTVDPRSTVSSGCVWSRTANPSDVPGFFGSCGVTATMVPLPVQMC